ncbi:MAG: monofunctional biosynthetic peptidoglycan transglycosylase [Bdellovibrio sp.]|nr:monofunctional biosynthetic peptidoglycan transglycosylase [Bdellovibrio sp.]
MKKLLVLAGIVFLVSTLAFVFWLPSETQIKGCLKTSMYGVDLCPVSKNYVSLSNISKNLQNAILLTEDSGFYQHNGFDQEGISHCIEKIKEKRKLVCGGSTITQQLAKNMFLSKDKSFFRKGAEAIITLRIEKSLTKREILERYLNVIQFGKNIYGIKQASQFYFRKSPSQLSVTESAFFAMILPNPEKYSQSYYRKDLTKFARKRLSKIINDLFKYKKINENQYLAAEDSLDFFLRSGQAVPQPKEQEEILTEEDLSEMEE